MSLLKWCGLPHLQDELLAQSTFKHVFRAGSNQEIECMYLHTQSFFSLNQSVFSSPPQQEDFSVKSMWNSPCYSPQATIIPSTRDKSQTVYICKFFGLPLMRKLFKQSKKWKSCKSLALTDGYSSFGSIQLWNHPSSNQIAFYMLKPFLSYCFVHKLRSFKSVYIKCSASAPNRGREIGVKNKTLSTHILPYLWQQITGRFRILPIMTVLPMTYHDTKKSYEMLGKQNGQEGSYSGLHTLCWQRAERI